MQTPKDDSYPYAQANQWYSIYREELYIYFIIYIYIILYIYNKISDYWDIWDFILIYPILVEMSWNRF
jgi:hypothetical protein